MCCSWCVAVCCGVAVCCSVHIEVGCRICVALHVLKYDGCVAVRCSVLQRVAACGSAMQMCALKCVAVCVL